MTSWKTVTTLLLSLAVCVITAAVDVSILDPETLSDAIGNTADKDSNITYAPLDDDITYKAEAGTDLGAIGVFYDLAQSIVDTSLPGPFPFDWVEKIKDGKLVIGTDWKELVTSYLGYVIAVAIGLLFFIIFPIVGFCFCCCRCCGNCGGKRVIKAPEEGGYGRQCCRVATMIILAVVVGFAVVGSALMFVTNQNLSNSIKDFGDKDVDKLDDITSFFDATIHQANKLVNNSFNFTVDVLFRDLDNIGFLLGQNIKRRVLSNTGLDGVYSGIEGMDTDAKTLRDLTHILMIEKNTTISSSQTFMSFTTQLQADINSIALLDFKAKCPNYTINETNFHAEKLPIEDLKYIFLNNVTASGITKLTTESKNKLNDIPERVQNETEGPRTDLRKNVNDYTAEISKINTKLNEIRDNFLGKINFDSIKADVRDYVKLAVQYDQYRWYGGLGLAGVALLISVLLGLGLLFGCLGGNAQDDPTERSSCSNHGGNCLTAAIMLTFIFGWLIMLITTILFAVGAPTDKFVCSSLKDISVVEKIINDFKLLGSPSSPNSSWLGDQIYQGKNVNISIADVMNACKNDATVYTALKMKEGNIINLTEITDYGKTFSISNKIKDFNVGFDGINITSDEMMKFIDFMGDFDNQMNYSQYDNVLSLSPINTSELFLNQLTTYITSISSGPDKTKLQQIQANLTSHLNAEGLVLKNSINNITSTLGSVKATTQTPADNPLKKRCDTLKANLTSVQNNLETAAGQAFNASVKEYEARLKKIFDNFVQDIKDSVENDIGKCKPLWNIFNSVVLYGVCDSTIGALNGWWCALGWTVFFLLLSICVSSSMSKYFFKMRYANTKTSEPPIE
ncbi:prominin-1-A-like [Physella acuta]|uniref:prominin-1-A-like n=1 Tax=Physella acuta TaxID=109671 RepID=UPI0027DDA7F6|nr:prominin-1-A-like [Physella acuta]